jgi:hypothetical protein
MNLYRALYQAPDSHIRGLTFAAATAAEATRIAEDWQIRDRLLTVLPVRPLQPQLRLVP